MAFMSRQRLSLTNLSFQHILITLAVLGMFGLGLLFAPGGPSFGNARLELGGALVSGVVLSGAFLAAERRLEAEDRKHEERVAAKQTRAQYQLALGMADTLAGRELSGLDLSGLKLPDRDLTGTKLRYTDLFNADLGGANLAGADLAGADLTKANLHHANLTRANLMTAKIAGAELEGADLSWADLSNALLFK